MTKLSVARLLGYKLLSEELIENIRKVGHDEDDDHHHRQIGCLYPGLGEEVIPVIEFYLQLVLLKENLIILFKSYPIIKGGHGSPNLTNNVNVERDEDHKRDDENDNGHPFSFHFIYFYTQQPIMIS